MKYWCSTVLYTTAVERLYVCQIPRIVRFSLAAYNHLKSFSRQDKGCEQQYECRYLKHYAQLSRGTKRRRDEEYIMTKQIMPNMKPPTHKRRRTATEEPPWNVSRKTTGARRGEAGRGRQGGACTIFLARNLILNTAAAPN